jgi:hypothetical protein
VVVTVLVLISPRDLNDACALLLPEEDSQTGDADLVATQIKATPVTMAVEALPLSSSRDAYGAHALQLVDQDTMVDGTELATTPLKAMPPSAPRCELSTSSTLNDVDLSMVMIHPEDDSKMMPVRVFPKDGVEPTLTPLSHQSVLAMVVPPSEEQTKFVATELSQSEASPTSTRQRRTPTSTPLPEFHELTSSGSLAHPPSQLQVYTRQPRTIVMVHETDSR